MTHSYLLALGSNMRVPGIGSPRRVLAAALVALEFADVEVLCQSAVVDSRPHGPSARLYANAAATVETARDPLEMLSCLQKIERDFGRRRRGVRWRARPLDLDIILWSGGTWLSPDLTIPHPEFRFRHFVTAPSAAIAPHWRDPVTGLTLRQIAARGP